MIAPAVFWPSLMGGAFLVAGTCTYRRDVFQPSSPSNSKILALGPVFIAASLAAFAGEHFTAARSLSALVPKWMPARLFIAYFVGAAHTAAALSLVARRCLRWSTFLLGVMFALFVLLLHLPNAVANPSLRIAWIVTVRETTFALGALSMFAVVARRQWPDPAKWLTAAARFWSAMVLIYFGVEHFLHPTLSPGVPDSHVTASWVALPRALAYLVGALLIAFGFSMFLKKYARTGAEAAGLLMLLLTILLYVPQFVLARGVPEHVNAINFIFDTMLFSGAMLVIARAILDVYTGSVASA